MINLVVKGTEVPTVKVFLEQMGGEVKLQVDDGTGRVNTLLKLTKDGRLYRYSDVDKRYGFQLDDDDRIVDISAE